MNDMNDNINDPTDIATWNDQDIRDCSTWGRCWCGRPRRSYIEQREDGPFFGMRCDAGHEPPSW